MGISIRSRSLVLDVLLGVVALAIALGATELLFRVLDLRGYHTPRTRDWEHALVPEAERLPDVGIQFAPDSEFALEYDSNPRGYFDEPGHGLTYRINRHGFRGDDFSTEKPEGGRRIVLLGDSFAFGEGVRFPDTLGERLERMLAARDPAPIEVLNLAVSGAGTLAELSYLRHVGIRLEPDLVVLVYVLNDAGAGRLNLWEDFTEQYEKRWLRGSYVASWVYARIGRTLLGRRYVDGLVESAKGELAKWNRSLDRISEASRVAHAAGSNFAVVIFPFLYRLDAGYPFRDFHRMVSRHCEDEGIPVLDLFDVFEGRTDVELWVHPSDQHPNEIAHGIAADAIDAFVTREALLAPRS